MALHSRARGSLAQLAPLSPGRKPQPPDQLQHQVAQLQREVARLQARLQQAETVIEIQKKVALLLGEAPPVSPSDDT
jgi:transposase